MIVFARIILGVIVGSKVQSGCHVSPLEHPSFDEFSELVLVVVLQILDLLVERFHGIFVLLARVTNDLAKTLVVEVEIQVRAEKLTLIENLVLDHYFL